MPAISDAARRAWVDAHLQAAAMVRLGSFGAATAVEAATTALWLALYSPTPGAGSGGEGGEAGWAAQQGRQRAAAAAAAGGARGCVSQHPTPAAAASMAAVARTGGEGRGAGAGGALSGGDELV